MTTTAQVHAHTARQQRAAATAIAIAGLADRPHPDSLRLYTDDDWFAVLRRAGVDPVPYVTDGSTERRDAAVAAYRAAWEQPQGDAAFDGLDF